MARVITYAEWQWDQARGRYVLLREVSHDYDGPWALAGGSSSSPKTTTTNKTALSSKTLTTTQSQSGSVSGSGVTSISGVDHGVVNVTAGGAIKGSLELASHIADVSAQSGAGARELAATESRGAYVAAGHLADLSVGLAQQGISSAQKTELKALDNSNRAEQASIQGIITRSASQSQQAISSILKDLMWPAAGIAAVFMLKKR